MHMEYHSVFSDLCFVSSEYQSSSYHDCIHDQPNLDLYQSTSIFGANVSDAVF